MNMKHPLLFVSALLLMLFVMTSPLFAQDETIKVQKPVIQTPPMSVTYSPDYCEFSAKFPEEPYKIQECEDDAGTNCFEQVSFTRVYELSSTVTLRIVCNPSDPKVYSEYSAAVMGATLKGMTRDNYVKELHNSYREADGYKQAGLVAEGIKGMTDKIYVAQLWIGRQSVLTVEAQMIGEPNDAGDALFSVLLDNIGYTGVKLDDKKKEESDKKEEEEKK